MRHIFLLQGLPASGKSAFIRSHKLMDHTLSYDTMREMFSISAHDLEGESVLSIRKGVQTRLISAVHDAAEYRMSNGDTLFIDNTNTSRNALKPWLALARKYDYTPHVLSFRSDKDALQHVLWDSHRKGREYVGEETIYRMAKQLEAYVPHPEVTHVYENHWDYVRGVLSIKETKVSEYDEIMIVGDVQGCGNALEKMLDNFGGFDSPDTNRLWVFVGDLYDRGLTPEKVFDLTWPNPRNVIIVQGNHERSVRQTIMGAREFKQSRETTLNHIPEEKHKSVLKQTQRATPIVWFKFGGNKFVVTHAGIDGSLASRCTRKGYLAGLHSDYEFYIGASDRGNAYHNIGTYDNFMEKINQSSDECGVIQAFGHRNNFDTYSEPANLYPNLIPLEDKVEFGGNLVAAQLTKDGGIHYHTTQED